jgi:O-antigen ligase
VKRPLQILQRAAHAVAAAGYIALALRFLIVAGLHAASPAAFLLLAGGAAAAAAWNPLAAFRAFALLYPLLFGLARMNLLAFSSADAVAFAALSIAAMSRGACLWIGRSAPRSGEPVPSTLGKSLLLAADLLAAWTVISFSWWIRGRAGDAPALKALLGEPTFGFSDALFPVADTLIWLMGWYYLRQLIIGSAGRPGEGAARPSGASGPLSSQGAWLCLCLLSWAFLTLAFFYLQHGLGLIDGFSYGSAFIVPTSMFNDPHTFGGVSASLAVALLAWTRGGRPRARILTAVLAAALLGCVIVCYSRAAWLAAAVALGMYLAIRQRRLAYLFAALVALTLGVVAWRADDILRLNRPYLVRLVYFVRLDRLSDYHEARFTIYRRIPAMISAHPLLGHGPGSSRVSSIPYVAVTDLTGPDFIHNAVLQAAVEQGVPAGVLLSVLLFLPLLAAVWRWRTTRLDPIAVAACLALLAFLLTQLTSNSMNVYVDQQFFFWTLAGLLLARLPMRHESGEQALVTGQAGGHG